MKKSEIGYSIISSAIVWGAVMIACGAILSGTPYKQDVSNVLIAGASFHLLFIWIPLGKKLRKKSDKTDKDKLESKDNQEGEK